MEQKQKQSIQIALAAKEMINMNRIRMCRITFPNHLYQRIVVSFTARSPETSGSVFHILLLYNNDISRLNIMGLYYPVNHLLISK